MVRHHPEIKGVDEKQPKVVNILVECTLHECSKLPANSERAKKITQSIAHFISKDLRPYNIVDIEGFRYMISTVEPKYVSECLSMF